MSDEREAVDLDSIDLLALWRTVPFGRIGKATLTRLVAALIAFGRAAEPGLEQLLLRAQARDSRAWLELSEIYRSTASWDDDCDGLRHGSSIDAHCSCLLVASAYGSHWAAAMLVLRLARRELRSDDPLTRVEILAALTGRFSLPSVKPTAALDYLGVRDVVESDLKLAAAQATAKPLKASVNSDAVEPIGPAVIVLPETLDPTSDREMKAIVDRFGILAKPVALREAPDPEELASSLIDEFPWAIEAIEGVRVELHLARRLTGGTFRLPPILLVGEPGVGKSTFLRRLSYFVGIPSATVLGSGMTDNRLLAGTAKGWSSANPSFPIVTIRRHMVANPILVFEDIDRAGGNARHGRVSDTLATMLEPSAACSWLDECLQVPVNLSHISWFLTANRVDRVDPAVRARCRIVRFGRPRPRDFDVLLAGILRELADEHELPPTSLPDLPHEVVAELRRAFSSGCLQARQLAMLIRRSRAFEAEAERSMAH